MLKPLQKTNPSAYKNFLWIHWITVGGICIQYILATQIPDDHSYNIYLILHIIVGIGVLLLVGIMWRIFLTKRIPPYAPKILFPYTREGFSHIIANIKTLLHFKLINPNNTYGIIGFVVGINMILITGTVFFGVCAIINKLFNFGFHFFGGVHGILAFLLLIGLIGHMTANILHRIFSQTNL